MNTPIGREQRLVDAGIRLPSVVDAQLVDRGPERLETAVLEDLSREDAASKIFGPASTIELRREPALGWYAPGFLAVTGGMRRVGGANVVDYAYTVRLGLADG